MAKPIRILMFVGWKVRKCNDIPADLQPPDYHCRGERYWFFRQLNGEDFEVDVVDTASAWGLMESLERRLLHFYLWQGLRSFGALKKYDLILSHGAQSGIFLAFVRSLMGVKTPPHIIIDVGSLNGGRDGKTELILFRIALRSVAGIIYHVKQQELHYRKYFPEIVAKSRFVPFGPDKDLFSPRRGGTDEDYILSVGYAKRDWPTLIKAYDGLRSPKPRLRIIGDANPIPRALPLGVEAIGRVPFRDMIREISASRFIVIPLPPILYAVGQMTVLQSMAMGKAVIVSRVPSMVDYIVESDDGLFYRPGDPADLKKKMQYLIENPRILQRMGANARITTEKKFNEATMAQSIRNAIFEFIPPSA